MPTLARAIAASLLCVAVASPAQAQSGSDEDTPPSVIVSRDATVTPGDTLHDIAERELGLRGLASALADFNGISIDANLSPGSSIRIPIHVPDRGEGATVIFSKGLVTINGEALDISTLIVPGDFLETGPDGFLSIEFSNGSAVNLQPESAAVLQQLRCLEDDKQCVIDIETTEGQLSSEIERRDGQPLEYRVSTPYASAAVRGTDFDVLADASALRIAVTEGEVNVSALGTRVALDEGFGSITEEGQAPGSPIDLLPAPAFRYVPGRVVAGDPVSWWQLTEVDEYRAGISTDSRGRETVAELGATGDRIDIGDVDGLGVGDYFLSLRGVDENGIPGFRSRTRIVVASVNTDLVAPAVNLSRDGNDTLVAVVDPDIEQGGYEIQISATETFDDPLSVDVGPTGSAIFRFESDVVFARARQLQNPTTVSAFGATSETR